MDNIKKKLNKWGYGYEFPKKGNITITQKPESSKAKLNEILHAMCQCKHIFFK